MEDFKREGEVTFEFLTYLLKKLSPVIIDEAQRLNVSIPDEHIDISRFPEIVTSELLEYNIDDEDKGQQQENIVKIASEFIRVANSLNNLRFYEPYEIEEIYSI